MSKAAELVDFYDDDGNVLGFCTRQEADDQNLTYPNAIIFVFDSSKEVILQVRADNKSHYPGLINPTACGAIEHGEDPIKAAERELFEEVGITTRLTLVDKYLNVFPGDDPAQIRKRMSHLFVGYSNDEPTPNHEVKAVVKQAIELVLASVKSNPDKYVPSFQDEFDRAVKGLSKV